MCLLFPIQLDGCAGAFGQCMISSSVLYPSNQQLAACGCRQLLGSSCRTTACAMCCTWRLAEFPQVLDSLAGMSCTPEGTAGRWCTEPGVCVTCCRWSCSCEPTGLHQPPMTSPNTRHSMYTDCRARHQASQNTHVCTHARAPPPAHAKEHSMQKRTAVCGGCQGIFLHTLHGRRAEVTDVQ